MRSTAGAGGEEGALVTGAAVAAVGGDSPGLMVFMEDPGEEEELGQEEHKASRRPPQYSRPILFCSECRSKE